MGNLTADATESVDLCSKFADRCADMTKALNAFSDSVDSSKVLESQCEEGPVPPSPSPPTPTPIPSGGFALETADGRCLTVAELVNHGVLTVDMCDAGSRWDDSDGFLTNLGAASSTHCLHIHFNRCCPLQLFEQACFRLLKSYDGARLHNPSCLSLPTNSILNLPSSVFDVFRSVAAWCDISNPQKFVRLHWSLLTYLWTVSTELVSAIQVV